MSHENPIFGVLAHGYQPPRSYNVEVYLEGVPHQVDFSIVPWVNDEIAEQVYKPILTEIDRLPGLVTSIYAPLRAYLKKYKPEVFSKIQTAARKTPNREYSILGDPLVHDILPLLPPADQKMLFESGKIAFESDFGFTPKGVWLPETAVSKEVLHQAAVAGFEFVPLRDNQVTNLPWGVNLDDRHNVCFVKTWEGFEMAVLLGNSKLSGEVSYLPWMTYDADEFMNGRQNNEKNNGWNALMMMDLERFGHHQAGAEWFLKRILQIQENYGFEPLNMKKELKGKNKTYVDVRDYSSWSCDHNLGRWTGECSCDNPSWEALKTKREYFRTLIDFNNYINESMDAENPGWRDGFAYLLADLSDDIFTGENFGPKLQNMVYEAGGDDYLVRLYLAKIEVLIGLTSCGWFFGGEGRPERDIPASMTWGIKDLFGWK